MNTSNNTIVNITLPPLVTNNPIEKCKAYCVTVKTEDGKTYDTIALANNPKEASEFVVDKIKTGVFAKGVVILVLGA